MPQAAATIVVPCYNEQNRLDQDRFLDFANTNPIFHFLMVNDGSTDGTSGMLENLSKKCKGQIEVLNLPKNSGKAEAVRHGMLHALNSGAYFTAFWDADLATPLETIPLFLEKFRNPEIEMIFGSRIKLMGHDIQRNEVRHYLGRIFATCASTVLRLSIYDTQCGAKMFRASKELREALEKPFLSRWIFDVELIARLRNSKRKAGLDISKVIYELPLPVWRDIQGSKLKSTDFVKALGELIQIATHY